MVLLKAAELPAVVALPTFGATDRHGKATRTLDAEAAVSHLLLRHGQASAPAEAARRPRGRRRRNRPGGSFEPKWLRMVVVVPDDAAVVVVAAAAVVVVED